MLRPRYARAVAAFIGLAMIRIMLKRLVANPFSRIQILSGLLLWLSDTLCRLTSGGAFSTRRLFTDQTNILF